MPVRSHGGALLLLPLLAGAFLFDVLVLDRSLSAFDIVAAQPGWSSEFGDITPHQRILGDNPAGHYPERRLNWELLRQGHRMGFNPYIYGGTESLGFGVGAFVTSLPQLWLDTPDAIDWSTWIRLSLAGLFMYALLATLPLGRVPSLFGAIAWTYSLHQIVWLEFPQHLSAQLWIPLLMTVNLWILREGVTRRNVLWLAVINVLFYTSGYIQVALYTYLLVGIFNTAYIIFDRSDGVVIRTRRWLVTHMAYLACVPLLVPTVLQEASLIQEGLRGTQHFRAGVEPTALQVEHIAVTIRNFLPNFADYLRFYSPAYLGGIWGRPYHSDLFANVVEGAAYIGALSLLLVLLAPLGVRAMRGGSVFLALVASLMLFLAINHKDPLVLSAARHIPLIGFGTYGRTITVVVLLLCVLAAMGLSGLTESLRRGRYGWPVAAVTVFLALPFACRLIAPQFGLPKAAHTMWLVGIFVVLAAIAMTMERRRWIGGIAIAILVADLFVVTYAFNTRLPNDRIFPENAVIRTIREDIADYRVAVTTRTPSYPPNVLSYYGIATVEGYLTTASVPYVRAIRATFPDATVSANGKLYYYEPNLAMLRLLNAKYLISDAPRDTPELELVRAVNDQYVYRLRGTLERLYCASDYLRADNEDAILKRLRDIVAQFDRPAAVASDLGLPRFLSPECVVSDIRVFTNAVTAKVSSPSDTLVIAPYAYSRHWRATVNGAPADVIRANYAFTAIRVPAGTSRVALKFEDRLLVAGAAVQATAGIGLVAAAVAGNMAPWGRLALVVVGISMAAMNGFAIPGARNDSIPERFPFTQDGMDTRNRPSPDSAAPERS